MTDCLIQNCRIFDGSTISDAFSDIAVADGIVRRIAPAGSFSPEEPVNAVFDAKGAIASVGFIDMHTHVYPLWEGGVYPEVSFFPSGITSAVDAGSAGCETLASGIEALASCRADIRFFINFSAAGLATLRAFPEYIDPAHANPARFGRLIDRFGDKIAGVKIRMGKETVRGLGAAPLIKAAEIAHSLGLPLMVHTTNPAIPMDEICSHLAPGDYLSHAFHGHGMTILGDDGHVLPGVREAKARGVLFDVGDANWHMSLDVLRAAMADGIFPDTISTDMTQNNQFRKNRVSLPRTMSKIMAAGMPCEQVLRAVTLTPGSRLGLPAALHEGETADITLFALRPLQETLTDGNGAAITAESSFVPLLTMKRGQIVWCDCTM